MIWGAFGLPFFYPLSARLADCRGTGAACFVQFEAYENWNNFSIGISVKVRDTSPICFVVIF
jgi:hypothetical protein